MSKRTADTRFGKGKWRGISRRGQNLNGKVHAIDNVGTSKTNFAACLQDTITITPADIGIQVLSWLFNGEDGRLRWDECGDLWVGLSSDDLADANH